jgi:transcriptional regulator with XRE-family HTH domain
MLRGRRPDGAAGPRIIPERIREAREAAGLTMEQFAEKLGVSKQAVGQYEVGQITPGAPAMSSIIAITGQPPSFFTAVRAR